MNEIEELRTMKFGAKHKVIMDMAGKVCTLDNIMRSVMSRSEKGISTSDLLLALVDIAKQLKELDKILHTRIVAVNPDTHNEKTIKIDILDSKYLEDTIPYLKSAAEVVGSDVSQTKIDSTLNALFERLVHISKSFTKSFHKYTEEAIALGYTTQERIDKVKSQYGIDEI